jgi:hypothetical protein
MANQAESKRIPFNTISQTLEQGIDGADSARVDGLQRLNQLRKVKATVLEREVARLEPGHPRGLALNERIELNRRLILDLAVEIEHAETQIPVVDKNTWVVHGFVRGKNLKGVPSLTVAIYDAKGTWIQAMGYACTDDKGYFKLTLSSTTDKTEDAENLAVFPDAAATSATRGPEVFIRVLDKSGVHIHIDQHTLTPQLGSVDYREIILSNGKGNCRPPSGTPDPVPRPQEPTEPVATRPASIDSSGAQSTAKSKDKSTKEREDK